ncbi:pentapeptide repeat-containing protein [Kitasatospora sp. NPDC048194]|uniref:pentapeptide repeat-containing protein n=1 Tax=Kitasatospora sp. NPDC048194 TaxID=3364045 RepID=UPI0037114DD9
MRKETGVAIGVALFISLFVYVLFWGVWGIDSVHNKSGQAMATIVSGNRAAIVAVGAGIVAAFGALATARAARKTWAVHRDGQVTDRYTAAIEHLASDNQVQQLGGIFALERIMRDSPPDQPAVAEVLASFIRKHSPASSNPPLRVKIPVKDPVHAALRILVQRPLRDEGRQLNLRGTNLSGMDIANINANLKNADLMGAVLAHAHLKGANFESANLINAKFYHADMTNVILTDADISGADLSDVRRGTLTVDQVLRARPSRTTVLPKEPAEEWLDQRLETHIKDLDRVGNPKRPGGRGECGCEILRG